MSNTYVKVFEILKKVYGNQAYLGLLLDNADFGTEQGFALRLLYGVIEKDVELEYHIARLCKKRPKLAIRIIIKMGMYLVKYMDSIPEYTAVFEMVELTKTLKKGENSGFVNSVLRSFIKDKETLPNNDLEKLAISLSLPLWLIKKYKKQYSDSEITDIVFKSEKLTHVRVNTRAYDIQRFYDFLDNANCEYQKTQIGAFVKSTGCLSELINKGLVFVQSLGSAVICDAFKEDFQDDGNYKILDMCSAPGGKTVYLSELFPSSQITALELYDNRVNLIENYKALSGAKNVDVMQFDSTIFNPKFVKSFDMILCDVPCMGLGVVASNPDILLHRKEEDLPSLTATQRAILKNAAIYLKDNGTIVYSTCSTLKEENQFLTSNFCTENGFQKSDKLIHVKESGESFYLCRIKK